MILTKLLINRLFIVLSFCTISATIIYGQSNDAPKKIHLVRMLDFFSDYSEENSYTMRTASNNIQAYFEAKTLKLANDITNGQLEIYDIYDDLEATRLTHNPFKFPEKNRFSKDTLIQKLQNMSCEGDVVILIFNGHGFSAKKNQPQYDSNGGKINYPDLIFTYNRPDSEAHYIPYKEILCAIQKKKPALILSVVSACQIELDAAIENELAENYNGYTRDFQSNFSRAGLATANYNATTNQVAVRKSRAKELFQLTDSQAYPNLGKDQTLSVELLSCSKGEYTWVDAEGGHFMTAFIDAFDEALESTESVNWQYIAANTQFKAENRIKAFNYYELAKGNDLKLHDQTPQCKVYIKEQEYCNTPPRSLKLPRINKTGNTPLTPIRSEKTFYQYSDHLSGKRATPLWLAKRFLKLGESYRTAGSFEQAIRTLKTAIPVLKKYKEDYRLATAYERLGLVYRDQNNLREARSHFLKAKEIFVRMKVDGSISVIDGLIEQLE